MIRSLCTGFLVICTGLQVSISDAQDMVSAAKYFMSSFGRESYERMAFDVSDDERTNWHYFPKERKGISFDGMDEGQKKLAHALILSGLSHDGYEKAMRIMYLEKILYGIEGRASRNPGAYFVSLFGKPGGKEAWGWRLEGHHLSLNFTLWDGKVVSFSPLFMGANPGEVKQNPSKGLRVLAKEEDLGRKLVQSLSSEQQKMAIFSDTAPADIITRAEPRVEMPAAEGIPLSQLTENQQDLLMRLIQFYAGRLRPVLAEEEMAKVQRLKKDQILFAWAGGLQPGQGHYYRIQTPSFLIEYDNTQNHANHIHTVWRDPANDFGYDVLKEHYQHSPHHH